MSNIVPIDEINDGMVVAEPIVNSFGQTLIPSGATLKDSHKKLLKTWNIQTIAIQGDGQEEAVELTEEIKQLALEKLSKRLSWKPANPYEKDIFQLGILCSADTIMKQK